MKKIKLVLIHLADMFDNYVLHNLADRLVNRFWQHEYLFNLHMRICNKICLSKWWGERTCKCFYCRKFGYKPSYDEE